LPESPTDETEGVIQMSESHSAINTEESFVTQPFVQLVKSDIAIAADCFMLLIMDTSLAQQRIKHLRTSAAENRKPPAAPSSIRSLPKILAALKECELVDKINQQQISIDDLAAVADHPDALFAVCQTFEELSDPLDESDDGLSSVQASVACEFFLSNSLDLIRDWYNKSTSAESQKPAVETPVMAFDETPPLNAAAIPRQTVVAVAAAEDRLCNPLPWLLLWKQIQQPAVDWNKLFSHAQEVLDSLHDPHDPRSRPSLQMLLQAAAATLEQEPRLSSAAVTVTAAEFRRDQWESFRLQMAAALVFGTPVADETSWQRQIREFYQRQTITSPDDIQLLEVDINVSGGTGMERHRFGRKLSESLLRVLTKIDGQLKTDVSLATAENGR
jgi:hypothetical protein